ncbi:chemotaxis protein CheA [Salirhabdus sp. Marseille-P4669]|uniref:chemotaxis protein CheA n=1 Tax=Salirhabdus sp. Marseille-P4669 TaxID=2042310 RepID=UPI000C7B8B16|nr:chemotaxis protein CheA [Salirhabdus sp. Marseille-P4669]
MDMNQYLEVFIDESNEHLQNINDNLLQLEKDPANLQIVAEIFRSAHTLKGMSATMGYSDLAELTHKMENVLDEVRNENIKVTTSMLDVVFEAVEHLETIVEDVSQGGSGKKDVIGVVEKLKQISNGEEITESTTPNQAEPQTESVNDNSNHNTPFMELDEFEQTVLTESTEQGFKPLSIHIELREDCLLKAARVYMVFDVLEKIGEVMKAYPSVDDLEAENFENDFHILFVTKEDNNDVERRILKVSEIDKVHIQPFTLQKNQTEQRPSQVQENQAEKAPEQEATPSNQEKKEQQSTQHTSKTIRVNINRLDDLLNLFEELVIDRGRLEQIAQESSNKELKETVERMTRVSGELQTIILNMRMVPIEQVFNRFPRMVRQLSRDLGKKVNLQIIGAETELDRTVIDEIGDPLVHLIRNGLDHGIETPEERLKSGKPEEGQLILKAYHSGNHVFVEIQDDGKGINREKVLEKAISKGLISKEEGQKLDNRQVNELIMQSGFSTADTISDISGRGVGLDVVKNKIESLGGAISIESEQGKGSLFSIQLPLTLSIISSMLVQIEKETFAIPLSSIIETAIFKREEILYAHGKEVIDFRGKVVPLINLKHLFKVPSVDSLEDDLYSVVIVRKGNKMAGLIVDSFIGQQEIVLKSLGDYLSDVFAISGASILGNGEVALIIDTNALIK